MTSRPVRTQIHDRLMAREIAMISLIVNSEWPSSLPDNVDRLSPEASASFDRLIFLSPRYILKR
jgi:hypothetical protein